MICCFLLLLLFCFFLIMVANTFQNTICLLFLVLHILAGLRREVLFLTTVEKEVGF